MMAGRQVKERDRFVFSTGHTVRIKRIGPYVTARLQAELLKRHEQEGKIVSPPVEDVAYGRETRAEPNYQHPVYLAAVKRWQAEFDRELSEIVARYIIEEGTEPLDGADYQADVARVRTSFRRSGLSLEDENEWFIYVMYVCCGTLDELYLLRDAVIGVSQATDQAVEDATRQFKSDVQTPQRLELELA